MILFQWLDTVFIPYLDSWEESVNSMTGVSSTEKNKMLLSQETLLGLRRTGIKHSIVV